MKNWNLLGPENFKAQDSLPTLTKSLLEAFKSHIHSKPSSKEFCDIAVNTEEFNLDKSNNCTTAEVGVNTDFSLDYLGDVSPEGYDPLPSSSEFENIDFSMVYDRLLEDRELQEKIAENINKRKADILSSPRKDAIQGESSVSQDLNSVIKAIVAETQADPAFDHIIKDCLGKSIYSP